MSKTIKRKKYDDEFLQDELEMKKKERMRRENRRNRHTREYDSFGLGDGGSESMYFNKG